MRLSTFFVGLLVIATLPGLATNSAAQPAVKIGDTQVTASGMTPAGSVFWFACARERTGWFSRVLDWERADLTADASGQAVLDLGRPVPVKAVFVAVDMTTGAFGASSPPAYPWATHVPFPAAGLAYAADRTSVVSLQDEHLTLEVLVVRPQVGAWRATVRHDDTAPTAAAGVVVTFANMEPWGKPQAALSAVRPGDLIVAIDPDTIEYFAQQLGAVQ